MVRQKNERWTPCTNKTPDCDRTESIGTMNIQQDIFFRTLIANGFLDEATKRLRRAGENLGFFLQSTISHTKRKRAGSIATRLPGQKK